MPKHIHPNQLQAVLEDLCDPWHSFPEHFPKPNLLNKYVEELVLSHSKTGNLLSHLEEQSVCYWDYCDKKCPYHRIESNDGINIASRIITSMIGKPYSEAKAKVLSKRLKYYSHSSAMYLLEEVFSGRDEDWFVNREGLIECVVKIPTTKTSFNPYIFCRFQTRDYLFGKDYNVSTKEKYENFIYLLEHKGYDVEIDGLHTSFKGHGICGYVSIDPASPYYSGKVFAEYYEFYDKVSRCSLKFEIPKSKQGLKGAMEDLLYLGTNKAKMELREDTYQAKHVVQLYY